MDKGEKNEETENIDKAKQEKKRSSTVWRTKKIRALAEGEKCSSNKWGIWWESETPFKELQEDKQEKGIDQ